MSLYSADDLSGPKAVVGTNVSPATLLPYYDPDTHLLFLSGKVPKIVQSKFIIFLTGLGREGYSKHHPTLIPQSCFHLVVGISSIYM